MEQPLVAIAEEQDCQTSITTKTSRPSQPSENMDYLSNLKAFLTALVIVHHTAIAYGGAGRLAYRSPTDAPGSQPALVVFNAFNQTFFMALFFFIAAYLSGRSLNRRLTKEGVLGARTFVVARTWRLAVPTLVYSVVGPPICRAVIAVGRGESFGWHDAWTDVTSLRGVRGPVWFFALLFLFDCLLAGRLAWSRRTSLALDTWEPIRSTSSSSARGKHQSSAPLLLSLSLLSLFDFVWRLCFPVGKMFTPLSLNLGYLPQYIAAYIFGSQIADPMLAVPSAIMCLIPGIASLISGTLLTLRMSTNPDEAQGGWNILAAAYAVWNNTTGYLVSAGLLRLFHDRAGGSYRVVTDLAFHAFLLHIPLSTAVQVLSESWLAPPLLKIPAVGAVNVLVSWMGAWIWRVVSHMVTSSFSSKPRLDGATTQRRSRIVFNGGRSGEILEGLDTVGR